MISPLHGLSVNEVKLLKRGVNAGMKRFHCVVRATCHGINPAYDKCLSLKTDPSNCIRGVQPAHISTSVFVPPAKQRDAIQGFFMACMSMIKQVLKGKHLDREQLHLLKKIAPSQQRKSAFISIANIKSKHFKDRQMYTDLNVIIGTMEVFIAVQFKRLTGILSQLKIECDVATLALIKGHKRESLLRAALYECTNKLVYGSAKCERVGALYEKYMMATNIRLREMHKARMLACVQSFHGGDGDVEGEDQEPNKNNNGIASYIKES
jgi:hypothetical protein